MANREDYDVETKIKELTTDHRMQTIEIDHVQQVHDLISVCSFYKTNTDCYLCPVAKICNDNWKPKENYPCTWKVDDYTGY